MVITTKITIIIYKHHYWQLYSGNCWQLLEIKTIIATTLTIIIPLMIKIILKKNETKSGMN